MNGESRVSYLGFGRRNWPPRFNAELTRQLNFLNINFREALLRGKLMLTIET